MQPSVELRIAHYTYEQLRSAWERSALKAPETREGVGTDTVAQMAMEAARDVLTRVVNTEVAAMAWELSAEGRSLEEIQAATEPIMALLP